MNEVAVSTVAASCFSTLNVNGPMQLEALVGGMRVMGFDCDETVARTAVRELVGRGLVKIEVDGLLVSRYPANWVMAQRDREQADGWSGWVMKNLRTGEHKLLASMEAER